MILFPAAADVYRCVQVFTAVPVLGSSRCRGLQFLQTLLEEFFVLVDEMFLHLRHLSHDLLPPEPSHLRLPLPLRLVFVSHRLQGTTPIRCISRVINNQTCLEKTTLFHFDFIPSIYKESVSRTSSGPCPWLMVTVEAEDVRSLMVLMFVTI